MGALVSFISPYVFPSLEGFWKNEDPQVLKDIATILSIPPSKGFAIAIVGAARNCHKPSKCI